MRLGRIAGALLFLLAGSVSGNATAAEPDCQVENQNRTEPADRSTARTPSAVETDHCAKKWKFATIGYAWFAGAHGKTDVIGPVEPVDLDLSFGDVLKAFKFAFMGAAEARRDRLLFLGDLTFIHLDTKRGIGIRDPDFVEAELDSRTAEITLLGGYRVLDKGPVTLDLLGGGRMNFFKTTLQLEGPNRSADGSNTQKWFDPVIAARAGAPLGGNWSLSFYGDVGGVVVGSDITWQAAASVDYQVSRKIRLGGGWRYFKVKYDDGDFLYNVAQSGPVLIFRTEL